MKLINEADVRDKRVIVRVDWNITLGKALQVVDDTRIKRSLETLNWLLENKVKQIVLLSHLGRPAGKVVPELSLAPVVKYASKLWGVEIELVKELSWQSNGKVVMLENLRFWKGEKENNREFVDSLSQMGEIYVNEAFADCHRESASIVGLARLLSAYAGFNLKREVEEIMGVMENPQRPLVVIMGGAKVEDKLKVLRVMVEKADVLLVGGKLANELGTRKIELKGRARVVVPVEGVDLLDIGRETQMKFSREIAKARTIVWNGPMGKVEDERYRAGTHAVYQALVKNQRAQVVVGGGDTLASIRDERHLERIDWISTGGGAMLKLIEKGTLPGIDVLK